MGYYYSDVECRTCGATWTVEADAREGLVPQRWHTGDQHFNGCTGANLWVVEEGLRLAVQARYQPIRSQTLRRLEDVGVGAWEFTSQETLIREYDPPRCTCRLPRLHTQVMRITAVLQPQPPYRDGWAWEIHRVGGPSTTPAVETWPIPDTLENAALAVDASARTCPGNRNAPHDSSPRKHGRSIFGPGMTRCGKSIEAHWDENRIVDDPRRATCRTCISYSQQPHYTPGYETTIRGVKVLRLPVGKGWKVRCTHCDARLDVADPGGGYIIPFQAVQAAVKAHAMPGHEQRLESTGNSTTQST